MIKYQLYQLVNFRISFSINRNRLGDWISWWFLKCWNLQKPVFFPRFFDWIFLACYTFEGAWVLEEAILLYAYIIRSFGKESKRVNHLEVREIEAATIKSTEDKFDFVHVPVCIPEFQQHSLIYSFQLPTMPRNMYHDCDYITSIYYYTILYRPL